jgi:kynureninase
MDMTITELDCARELDARDPLRAFRDRFVIADPELVYLDGNSLGRLPRTAVERANECVGREWGERLIGSWNDRWFHLPEQVGGKIARLIGARPDEVIVADSTSVNLFKLAVAALRNRPNCTHIVTDDLNFPSDLYVLQAALDQVNGAANSSETGRHARSRVSDIRPEPALLGRGTARTGDCALRVLRSGDGWAVPRDEIAAAIDSQTALLALSHTSFKSASVYDMAAVTELAHARGALVLWDLSHSVGAMPIALNEAEVDLAVGCTYKFLNGGPGAPAFLYVRRELQDELMNPIAGWFGQAEPFRFELDYRPSPGIRRFLTGTPPVLSLALIEPGVDLVIEAGIDRIRAKSLGQTEYLVQRYDAWLAELGYTLNSPRDGRSRGSHVALGHPEGLRISRALKQFMNVVPDFRRPDHIRLGVSPLVTTYEELHRAAQALRLVVRDRWYDRISSSEAEVT